MPTAARPRVVAGLRLLAPVGQGAEGEVWEARDARGRRRAMKLIRPGALVEPAEVQRRGAWLVEVDHPALVRVWRTGILRGGGLDGWGFVEMSFVDGRSTHGSPAMPGVLERLEPLAEGVDLLHAGAWSQGVPLVHRDIKPANLIDSVDGGLVLVDHSTLRAADLDTVTRIGTPVFAAPEVITGRMGPPADVYSFSATAVALLSGARGERLADLLADPERLDVPEGLRAGLRERASDRPWCCRAVLEVPGFVVAAPAGQEGMEGSGQAPDPGPVEPATQILEPGEDWPLPGDDLPEPGDDLPEPGEDWPLPGQDLPLPREGQADRTAAVDPGAGAGTPPPAAPRRLTPWVLLLVVVALAPALAAEFALPSWPDATLVLLAAGVAHLAGHALLGGHPLAALLAPPLAWASVLAERATVPGRRRDWALPLLLGAMLVVSAGVVLSARVLAGAVRVDAVARLLSDVPGAAVTPRTALAATGVALALVVVCTYAARRGGFALRLALVPVWAAGAALLVAGGMLLLPLALLTRRAGALSRLLRRTVAGALAVARPDRPRRVAPSDLDDPE